MSIYRDSIRDRDVLKSIQKCNVDMFLLHVLFTTAWLLLLRLFAARAIELSHALRSKVTSRENVVHVKTARAQVLLCMLFFLYS